MPPPARWGWRRDEDAGRAIATTRRCGRLLVATTGTPAAAASRSTLGGPRCGRTGRTGRSGACSGRVGRKAGEDEAAGEAGGVDLVLELLAKGAFAERTKPKSENRGTVPFSWDENWDSPRRGSAEGEGDSPIFRERKLGQSRRATDEGDSPIFGGTKIGQSPVRRRRQLDQDIKPFSGLRRPAAPRIWVGESSTELPTSSGRPGRVGAAKRSVRMALWMTTTFSWEHRPCGLSRLGPRRRRPLYPQRRWIRSSHSKRRTRRDSPVQPREVAMTGMRKERATGRPTIAAL